MENEKVESLQTTLTQHVKKETRCRENLPILETSMYWDDTPIGHNVRRLLELPTVEEEVSPSKKSVTPVGEMHEISDNFKKGFHHKLYEDSQSDDSDFE